MPSLQKKMVYFDMHPGFLFCHFPCILLCLLGGKTNVILLLFFCCKLCKIPNQSLIDWSYTSDPQEVYDQSITIYRKCKPSFMQYCSKLNTIYFFFVPTGKTILTLFNKACAYAKLLLCLFSFKYNKQFEYSSNPIYNIQEVYASISRFLFYITVVLASSHLYLEALENFFYSLDNNKPVQRIGLKIHSEERVSIIININT